MKRTLKILIGKSINMFSYGGKIGKRVLKVIIQSTIICCSVMLILMIINKILGVNIRLSYYLTLATLVIVGLSLTLCMFKWQQIIAKPVRVSKKNAPTKTDRKTQRAIQRKRKRIS